MGGSCHSDLPSIYQLIKKHFSSVHARPLFHLTTVPTKSCNQEAFQATDHIPVQGNGPLGGNQSQDLTLTFTKKA
jgi:hypothetical protein